MNETDVASYKRKIILNKICIYAFLILIKDDEDGDKKVKEQNQQDCDQKQNVLLLAIKERFSENLEESKHSIIFLSVIQENGMEVILMRVGVI